MRYSDNVILGGDFPHVFANEISLQIERHREYPEFFNISFKKNTGETHVSSKNDQVVKEGDWFMSHTICMPFAYCIFRQNAKIDENTPLRLEMKAIE